MGLAEFVYRLAPLTATSALGDAWAGAARYAPPGVVAIAATRLPRPVFNGSPARTRLLALAALARAADDAHAPATGDDSECRRRTRELVVAERILDTLLPGCPGPERAVHVAALTRARRLRRTLVAAGAVADGAP